MADDRVIPGYRSAFGDERRSPDHVVAWAREVLADRADAGAFADVWRIWSGTEAGSFAGRTLRLEDGGEVRVGDRVPDDLPHGYHRMDGDDGEILVLHPPRQVPSAGARPGWVVVAQLYATRSADSWGHGDLRDARRLVEWVREGGPGGHVMINPLHAPAPGDDPEPSPYFASSRVFRNPLYLCVDELPGADRADVAPARQAALALNADRLLDRRAAWAAKRRALAAVWELQRREPAVAARVDRWLADPVNRRYATWCALVEVGAEVPAASAVDVTAAPGDEERFHAWLQLELEDQLHAVGDVLIHDVAVGTHRGADTWLWPGCYVLDGTRVGAPPDEFNTQGQDWGLPPYHPDGLRRAGYEPFVRAVRSSLFGAAGIRIDHVMGLERLWWVPPGTSPADGVYVRYDLAEMLDVIAIEAHRADAFVVGEDLGTVSEGIRRAMEDRRLLSYRVMALSDEHPHHYPAQAMAALTTHDLPTALGLLTGRDLATQEELDLHPNVEGTRAAVARLRAWAGADGGDEEPSAEEITVRLHEVLAGSPAHLVAATLEDLAGVAERPNMPGTTGDVWPSWRWGLPAPLDQVLATERARRIRAAFAGRVEG